MLRWRLAATIAWAGPLFGGCDEGRLVIELELPVDRRLDPTLECRGGVCEQPEARLSRLSLRISEDGRHLRTQDSALRAGAELSLGNVPVARSIDLRLAAHAVSGQVLGLGVVQDVVLSPGEETRVAMKLRKPIAYIAGGSALRAIDTAALTEHELPPIAIADLVDVAAARNGVLVAAITPRELLRLRTADHFAAGCSEAPPACLNPIDLRGEHGQPARCIVLSPDAGSALVCHETGLTAVEGLSSNAPRTAFFQLGKTGRPADVVFDRSGRSGWVLVNAAQRSCQGEKSVLVALDLAAGQPSGEPIAVGQPASAIALDPLSGQPLLALPCGESGKLGQLVDGQVQVVVEGLPPVFDLAVAQQNLVLVGRATAAGPRLRAQAVVIDRSDPARAAFPAAAQLPSLSRTFELPAVEVSLSHEASVEGYLLWISPARSAVIYDVEVAPDGQRAVLLVAATWGSRMQSADCVYRTEISGTAFLLVDLEAGKTLLHRFTQLTFSDCFTSCAAYQGRPMTDPAVCAAAFGAVLQQDGQLVAQPFDARSAVLLLGDS